MSDQSVDKVSDLLKLQFEDAPPFGGGSMPVEKEKTMVMLAHLFSWIVWLLMRNQSPAVDAHGKEATNFFITLMICYIPICIVLSLMTFLPGIVLTLISVVLGLVSLVFLVMVIIAMIKAKEGKLTRYPFNFRLIK